MRIMALNKIVGSFTLFLLLILATTHADAASPDLLKAKKEAEAKGYIFFTTHDEIVAMAKKEGKLRVMTGLESANFKPWINAFNLSKSILLSLIFMLGRSRARTLSRGFSLR
ncbi:MAG: hypothetical protein HYY45_16895 [Deltaproteobacteria bacterium]|nr:hypothetical protein [Deltaproteobacteria bacterium]